MRTKPTFEVSVDARVKGRRLDGYRPHRIRRGDDELSVLIDPDLQRLAVEVTVVAAGLFRRGLGADVDGIDGAPCPIHLIR